MFSKKSTITDPWAIQRLYSKLIDKHAMILNVWQHRQNDGYDLREIQSNNNKKKTSFG